MQCKTILAAMLKVTASSILALGLLAAPAAAQRLAATPGIETATFAGGCFWCVEVDFDKVDGVVATTSGFMGGTTQKPTYKQVSGGNTGHTEVVEVKYDPKKVSYERLVYVFWRTIDPLDKDGQFCDRGNMYRTAIFYHSDEQKKIAESSKAAIDASKKLGKPIVTEITTASEFTAAEDSHQDFYKKDPGRYYSYRAGCGRDARIKALWGDEAGGKVASQ